MKQFLLLFSGYRDLLLAHSKAEARLALWQERCERAERRLQEAQDRLIADSQKIADVMTQQALGRRLFSKAEMPVDPEHATPTASFSTARGERQRHTEIARANLKEFFQRQTVAPDEPVS